MTTGRGSAVTTLTGRILRDEIGGAAELAEEAARAIAADLRGVPNADFRSMLHVAFRDLLAAAPSVSPLTNVLHRIGSAMERPDYASDGDARSAAIAAADEASEWLQNGVSEVGRVGAAKLRDGECLFTYSTSGSVYEVVRRARASGKSLTVFTTESRPGREGLRTVPEMERLGVPVVLGIDGGVGGLLRECDSMWVGADTITSSGDALCKTGTLPAAMVAHHYSIPVYVAADTSKYDPATAEGIPLLVRQLDPDALVTAAEASHANVRIPLFEILPESLITAVVTELGVFRSSTLPALVRTSGQSELVSTLARSALTNQPSVGGVS